MRKLLATMALAVALASMSAGAFAQTQIAATYKTPSVQTQIDWFGSAYRGDGG
jgi:hypothetical protein